uniref:Uncharacterized protein n=1 Tax=Anguilla anguilla TaxID=7936 RepID=A0A0E9W6A7_ANGAN
MPSCNDSRYRNDKHPLKQLTFQKQTNHFLEITLVLLTPKYAINMQSQIHLLCSDHHCNYL